ncbi:hypothetical protein RBH26_05845 [Natronolimnohabitans sp. A-GB9]|uniref:hypothetical protein n=1 Tax=Natronolimnohabitans sp. A-GB9 TaxID=3069757 RepID=UPI0027B6F946|nr:hypothetical protein [Natronolimnohabitans sp. A-GB9]MDQ2050001.1 hypothetical protein [Natronolimnohabitans sp. A-GB9]
MSGSMPNTAVEGGERKTEIKRAMYILIVWISVAILAGILLVLLSDQFASLISLGGTV